MRVCFAGEKLLGGPPPRLFIHSRPTDHPVPARRATSCDPPRPLRHREPFYYYYYYNITRARGIHTDVLYIQYQPAVYIRIYIRPHAINLSYPRARRRNKYRTLCPEEKFFPLFVFLFLSFSLSIYYYRRPGSRVRRPILSRPRVYKTLPTGGVPGTDDNIIYAYITMRRYWTCDVLSF